jgi:hypothetical protein
MAKPDHVAGKTVVCRPGDDRGYPCQLHAEGKVAVVTGVANEASSSREA